MFSPCPFPIFTLFILTALALHRQSFSYLIYNYSPLLVQNYNLSLEHHIISIFILNFLFLQFQSKFLMFGSFSPFRCRRVTFLVQNYKNDYKNFIKISVAYFINSKLISIAYFMKSLFIQLMGLNRTKQKPILKFRGEGMKIVLGLNLGFFCDSKNISYGPSGLIFRYFLLGLK